KFSILNPALTQTLPPFQTAAGITDIMAHLYERYLTNSTEVEVTDRLIEALLLTMKHEGPRVIADPDNYEARANIMWAGMMAHNNSCGVGRSQDWSSHDIEHELSALYDCAHGAGLAVTMPAVFKYVMKHNVMRFAQVAVRVWGCSMDFEHPEVTALEGINAFSAFLTSLGMPDDFAGLCAKEEDIPTLVENLCFGNGRDGKVYGFVTLDKEDCTNIYKMMV
ncbi:MAG: iron-containing alcohol dehydrogenase, partial [Lachnospiraceae bacterium]|nr:iron-containing alcohol dehydrogenase [Lachnospiraceae bacterium]